MNLDLEIELSWVGRDRRARRFFARKITAFGAPYLTTSEPRAKPYNYGQSNEN